MHAVHKLAVFDHSLLKVHFWESLLYGFPSQSDTYTLFFTIECIQQFIQLCIMCESIPDASIPPGQTPGTWYTMSPRGEHLTIEYWLPPGIFKQRNTCYVTLCRHLQRRSEVKGFKHQYFGIKRVFINHKRLIKVMTIWFVFVRLDCLISWPVLCSSMSWNSLFI